MRTAAEKNRKKEPKEDKKLQKGKKEKREMGNGKKKKKMHAAHSPKSHSKSRNF